MNNRITVTGIVLSVMPVGDYNRRITILTKERGKISAFAQGARRPGNQFMGITQPCVFGEFVLEQGRDSYNLREVKVGNAFSEFRDSMEKMFYGMYFCEVADFLSREGNDEKDELKLLYASLRALAANSIPDSLVKAVFELKSMYVNGEGPLLSECVMCHGSAEKKYFSVENGGMICENCADKIPGASRKLLNESTWYTLWFIASTPPEKLYTFRLSEEVLMELSELAEKYILYRTDHTFDGMDLIKVLG